MINSIIINEAVLITLLICMCGYVTITDLRHGIIQNKVLLTAGAIGLLANAIYYLFFGRQFFIAFMLNISVMMAISITFYALHIWAAGDSKLLMLTIFLIPARIYYKGNNVTATVVIMIIIFSVAYLYIIGESIYLGIKEKNLFKIKRIKPDERIEKVLANINSPYVMPHSIGGIYDERTYEILPYFEKGDLAKHIPMSFDFIENVVVKSVNEGLKVLHDNNIIHRDIKPSNLFLSNDEKRVVLGDFGISSLLDSNVSVRATSMSRTFGYSAPEASSGFVSKESDYYSFGITLLHLAIGQDPFAGMTDMAILYQTINKPLDIPSTIPPRLQQLIRGLTVKDRNNRWGYDEVSRWLNNEDVEVKERRTFKGLKPYNFSNSRYYGLDEISMAFASDWDNATKHLYRGLVEKNIVQYGEEYSNRITDIKSLEDKDVAVFKMIYILNPNAPLCFKGAIYTDLQALGMAIKDGSPQIDDNIMHLISSGCLLEYIENNNFNDVFKGQIRFITQEVQQNNTDYYFALMYLLYPEIGFEYNGNKYVNLEDFIDDLEKNNANQIAKICQDLISDKMFIMWVYSLGYSKQVESWMKVYEKAVW